jgi:hypothetical protein
MFATVYEYFDQNIGATIDYFGVFAEVWLCVDHAEQLDHRFDVIKRAYGRANRRK